MTTNAAGLTDEVNQAVHTALKPHSPSIGVPTISLVDAAMIGASAALSVRNEKVREALKSIRIFAQDLLDNAFLYSHSAVNAKAIRDYVDKALASLDAPGERKPAPVAVPAGWQLVPVDPTAEMLEAGRKAQKKPRLHVSHAMSDEFMTLAVGYSAMLAAAPPPPVSQKGE